MLKLILIFIILFIFSFLLTHKIYKALLTSSFLLYITMFIHIAFWSIPSNVTNILNEISLSHTTLNILFLVPLGFYLVELFHIKHYGILLLLSIIFPFIIELVQELLFSYNQKFIYHTFDTMDIKCNFLGCFITSFTTLSIRKVLSKNQQQNNTN